MKALQEYINELPEMRRSQGIRFSMSSFISMIVVGYLAGNFSGKKLGRFFKNNEKQLIMMYDLKHGVPCTTRINTFLKELNFSDLNKVLHDWLCQYDKKGDWISIDGKALKSTFTSYNSEHQNFQSMISVFSQNLGVNLLYGAYENKKTNEPEKVIELLEFLKDKGFTITLDAVHFQKKQLLR